MIQIAQWKRILTLLVCAFGIVFALPNVLSDAQRQKLPGFMQKTISLGLELQGGSHLQLEVDLASVQKDLLTSLKDEVRSLLRKEKIGYKNLILDDAKEAIVLDLRDRAQQGAAQKALKKLDRDWTLSMNPETGRITLSMTLDAKENRRKLVIEQSIEVVRRRVDESGTKEPIIQRQGDNRIILQLPGVSDPAEVRRLLGKTAKLTFHMLDENANAGIDKNGKYMGTLPLGTHILPEMSERGGETYTRYLPVKKKVMVSGDTLVDAKVDVGQNGQPAVSLKFNSVGARKFADMSKKYLKKYFAIVLDNTIISAPHFTEVIPNGNGQISGSFTIKTANELALLLRAGSLPAPLKVVEERTVGPSLGADSIADGRNATLLAFALVAVFMIANYSLFGAFANIALVFNLILLFAALSLLQATLTLPGIAAIALTIGMAVDANVLIYERIKEEFRHGLRPAAAIQSGYKRAMTTIIDANLTSLIGSAVLFEFGTGPIRGFAVNLALGILISMFTAIALTKLLMAWWFGSKNRKELPL